MTSANWRWDSRRNGWQGYLLWYCAAGSGSIAYPGNNGATYPVQAGACFLFRMHEWHQGQANEPLDVHAIAFTTSTATDQEPGDLWPGQRRYRQLRRGHFVQDLIDRSIECHRDPEASEAAQAWLQSALRAVAEEDALPQLSGKALAQDEAVRQLQAAIRADLQRQWGSGDIMAALGLGREQALRVFCQRTGVTPTAWITHCRLERAAYLLRFSDLAIKDIAEAVGYQDPYFFSRQFKNIAVVHHGIIVSNTGLRTLATMRKSSRLSHAECN